MVGGLSQTQAGGVHESEHVVPAVEQPACFFVQCDIIGEFLLQLLVAALGLHDGEQHAVDVVVEEFVLMGKDLVVVVEAVSVQQGGVVVVFEQPQLVLEQFDLSALLLGPARKQLEVFGHSAVVLLALAEFPGDSQELVFEAVYLVVEVV